MNFISEFDRVASTWIKHNLFFPKLSWVLSRVNRGEVFALILIPLMMIHTIYKPLYISLPLLLIFTYLTDRLVLVLKKYFSRKRPLVSVMGKVDANPDMKHSFPSAHSANSMVVCFILVFGFGESSFLFIFSLFAGIGRLLTLHHFISDIIGGWIIGSLIGALGILTYKMIQLYIY